MTLLRRSGIDFGALNSPSKSKLASFATFGGFERTGSAAGSCVSPKLRMFGSGNSVRMDAGGLGRGGGVAVCLGGGGRAGWGIGLDGCDFTGALVTK